jgi:predicted peroxiredoxin
MKKKMMIIITHADDDPERANLALAFVAAMIAEGIDLAVVFMFRGVLLVKQGIIETIATPNVTPGKDLLPIIMEGDVKLMACTPCALTHGVKEDELLDGCRLISAPTVVPEMQEREVVTF